MRRILVILFLICSLVVNAADRYLVGTGSRNWNDTANWSTTSGGSGGASVPTSADNVFFDANSGTGTVTVNTIANMLNFDVSATTAITLSNAAYAFNVYGNLALSTNLTVSFTSTGYLYFKSTSTGKTITSNGNTSSWNRIYFDGIGGGWTLQDNWNMGSTVVYPTNGTFNTNDKTITSNSWNINGSITLNLGASTINTVNWFFTAGTINAGTSTINCIGNINTFNGAGKTYYNLYINQTTGSRQFTINGVNSFNNIEVANGSLSAEILLAANQTVTGTLTITGNNSTNYRLLVASNTIGTTRTITCNGTITASNVDFRDITGAGSASWNLSAITGGSGDCGGNSGITFTAAQKQYFKHTSGAVNFSDATKWFSDFSPRTTAGRVPLPQDDWDMDASSFTGTSTVTVNCPRIGRSCDMSGVNQAVTWSLANAIEVYGSYILGNNITLSAGFNNISLLGLGSLTFNPYGKASNGSLILNTSGSYLMQGNFTADNYTITRGTINQNGYEITVRYLLLSTNGILSTNNLITITGSTALNALNVSGTIISYSGSLIKFNPSSGTSTITIIGGGQTYNKVQFSGSHTGNFDITGSNTFAELIIDAGRKVRVTAGTTQNIGKLTAVGTAGSPITLTSVTAAQHTLNYTGSGLVECNYLNLSYSNAAQANKFYAGANSTNGGNNTNWIFTAPPASGPKWNGITYSKFNGVMVKKINGK